MSDTGVKYWVCHFCAWVIALHVSFRKCCWAVTLWRRTGTLFSLQIKKKKLNYSTITLLIALQELTLIYPHILVLIWAVVYGSCWWYVYTRYKSVFLSSICTTFKNLLLWCSSICGHSGCCSAKVACALMAIGSSDWRLKIWRVSACCLHRK